MLKGMEKLSPIERVVKALSKKGTRLNYKAIQKATGLVNTKLSEAISEIRLQRGDFKYGKFDKTYWFSEAPTWYSYSTDLSNVLPADGEFGQVSDTHLASIAERLDLVEEAYDEFVRRGIKVVIHTGDLTDGFNSYKYHINFVKVHGDQAQAKYAIDNYPRRKGITTYVISGNHDCDNYGRTGVDRLSLVTHGFQHEGKQVNGRDDIVLLSQFSHSLILPQEVRVDLLHPRGGGSYAKTYRHQKWSEEMKRNNRPDLHLNGHYHTFVQAWISGTFFVGAPGMQDETEFFKRLGYARNMGFLIHRYTIKKGAIKSYSPEAFMFDD